MHYLIGFLVLGAELLCGNEMDKDSYLGSFEEIIEVKAWVFVDAIIFVYLGVLYEKMRFEHVSLVTVQLKHGHVQ
jgi:hypothetical protein